MSAIDAIRGVGGSVGLGYTGQNSSSIYTPQSATAGGGTAAKSFSFNGANYGMQVPSWVWWVAAGVLVYKLVLKK